VCERERERERDVIFVPPALTLTKYMDGDCMIELTFLCQFVCRKFYLLFVSSLVILKISIFLLHQQLYLHYHICLSVLSIVFQCHHIIFLL